MKTARKDTCHMQRITRIIQNFIKKGDWVLLFLCLLTTGFGCVIISSATDYLGSYGSGCAVLRFADQRQCRGPGRTS